MEEVEKLAFNILGTVIVFIIVIYGMYRWLGTPECDSLANQTALQLKIAIEDVSKDDFPVWYGSAPPGPQDIGYLKTSPIRLCQDHASYAYWLQFAGGFPEYEIYYEEFPAAALTVFTSGFKDPSGTMLWTEDYPYGGQQSALLMWGIMRGVSIGAKIAKKVYNPMSLINKIRNYFKNFRGEVEQTMATATGVEKQLLDPKWQKNGLEKFLKEKRDINIIARIKNYIGAEGEIKGLNGAGILEKTDGDFLLHITDDEGKKVAKLIISKAETEMEVTMKELNNGIWSTVQKKIYVLYEIPGDPTSKIIDATTDEVQALASGEYNILKFRPSEVFKSYVDELEKVDAEGAALFKKVYSFPSDVPTDLSNPDPAIAAKYSNFLDSSNPAYTADFGSAPIDRFSKISWAKYVDEGHLEKLKGYFKQLEFLGYDTSKTTMTYQESFGFMDALATKLISEGDEGELYKGLVKESLKIDTRFADSVSKLFGIKSSDAIAAKNVGKFVDAMAKNDLGEILVHNKADFRLMRFAANEVKIDSAVARMDNVWDDITGIGTDWGWWKSMLKKGIGEENLDDIMEKYGEENGAKIVQDVVDRVSSGEKFLGGPIQNTLDFEKRINLAYLDRLADDFGKSATRQRAIDQTGLLLGVITQNKDPLPKSLGRAFADQKVHQAVYISSTKYFTPSNWLSKGIIGADMRGKEACGANSICIFNKGKAEVPYYLNESVEKYFIRVWRPVSFLVQYGGLKAAMMHVPSNPRFYVAGPCFAIAKIWKTSDNTIYIKPEKVDMQGKSSNYCYADEDLINQYFAIWASTEALGYVLDFLTVGSKTIVSKLVKETDPSNLIQMAAEMAISWPGWPYASLTYEDMQSQSGRAAYNELLEAIRGV